MEKIFNDIITFIAEMNIYLKSAIIALLAILDILLLKQFIKNLSNKDNKNKIKIVNILLFVIVSGIIILIGIYGFN